MAKAGAGAGRREQSEQLEHEQNRRRVGVLSDVPERPGLPALFRELFAKKRDSGRLNVKNRSFHQFGEPFADAGG